MNPPYGERIGEAEELRQLYALLGEKLRTGYLGWEAAVLHRQSAARPRARHQGEAHAPMFNGPIECRLLRLEIEPSEFDAVA